MLKSAVNNVVAGSVNWSLQDTFNHIRDYHTDLGWPERVYEMGRGTQAQITLEQHRTHCLAMAAECMEVLNAAPWKPWKAYGSSVHSISKIKQDVAEELADVLVFIGSITEVWDIEPSQLEFALQLKLQKNRQRITNGYNNHKPTDKYESET